MMKHRMATYADYHVRSVKNAAVYHRLHCQKAQLL